MATSLAPVGLTPEQIAERRFGIGASEVGAVLGLDRYKSPLDVWLLKTGRVAPDFSPSSQAAKMGHLLEPIVARLAEEAYDAECAGQVLFYESDTVIGRAPWHRATPDRIVSHVQGDDVIGAYENRWLLECKTKSWHTFKDFGAPGTDQVPDAILLQAMWQLDVTALTRCDVGVLVDGREFSMFRVNYDAALAGDVYDRVEEWWTRYVIADVEPPVSRASDVKWLKQKFAAHGADLLPPTPTVENAVALLADARAARVEAETREERAKADVMQLIGEFKGVHTKSGKISWSTTAGRANTDWKSIVLELNAPEEIVEKYTKIGASSRVFRFTPSKED